MTSEQFATELAQDRAWFDAEVQRRAAPLEVADLGHSVEKFDLIISALRRSVDAAPDDYSRAVRLLALAQAEGMLARMKAVAQQ